MSFPAYPTYKESGVDWLGAVPSDWVVAGLKHRFNIVGGSTPKSDVAGYWNGTLPWITPADLSKLQSRFLTQTIRSITEAGLMSCGTNLVPPDSVVLSTRAPIGSLAVTAVEACTNQGCKALVPLKGADSTFAFYALSIATEQLNVRGKGATFLELSSDELGAFSLTFPVLAEQRSIVAFLDRETAKIDALVEEQRRLIALLKEKRQAVISHAVTKGLNPDAPMKDSGVEWLGEVPVHWDIRRLSTLCDFEPGKAHEPFVDDDADDHIYVSARFVSTQGASLRHCSKNLSPARNNDILMVMSDLPNGRALARAYYVNDDRSYAVNQRICIIRPIDCFARFMYYQIDRNSGLLRHDDGLNQTHLPNRAFTKLKVCAPPLNEQKDIATYLDRIDTAFADLSREAQSAIGLLRERRAALISAAITGKIDVRGTAKVLPFPVDRARARGLVAAEITERSAHQATFGRVKLQKLAYLAEAHVGVNELEGVYLREAAGPLDREMIHEMEREAGALVGVRVQQPDGPGSAVTYQLGDRRGAHREELAALLGDRARTFDKLISDIGAIDTKSAEAVATLYAVWNDALIEGETPSDMEIKLGVLSEWHPEKAKKFRIDELQTWLDWMRRHSIVPTGTGPKTSTGRLFV